MCVNLACTSSIILQSHNTADAHLLIIRSPIFPQVFPFLFLLIRVLTSYNFRVLSVAWSGAVLFHRGLLDWFEVDLSAHSAFSFRVICVLSVFNCCCGDIMCVLHEY